MEIELNNLPNSSKTMRLNICGRNEQIKKAAVYEAPVNARS